ncbi:MAG: hypothetical protein Q7N87_04830 [Candidatus Uhrbacteria bacterium]|nr:hypothetical protein [Candidatus Uhrbacteria bacterium]
MRKEIFTREEWKLLGSLYTPRKIQDFLNRLPINFEPEGDTCLSPRRVLRERRAHCIEGAMLAALALRFHGKKPLVVDLTASDHDDDHVIAIFRQHGCWGAISKSNHITLRYREPVYRTVRELVMSYFHEYFTQRDRKKTLRSYSMPVNLSRFDRRDWMTAEEDVWDVPEYLCEVRHFSILSRAQIQTLRPVDQIEKKAGEIVEWRKNRPLIKKA